MTGEKSRTLSQREPKQLEFFVSKPYKPILPLLQREDAIRKFLCSFERRFDHECWPWIGTTVGYNRGILTIAGSAYIAARVSFAYFRQADPVHFMVCHCCDNENCVNPDHLYCGTNDSNGRDRKLRPLNHFRCNQNRALTYLTQSSISGDDNPGESNRGGVL